MGLDNSVAVSNSSNNPREAERKRRAEIEMLAKMSVDFSDSLNDDEAMNFWDNGFGKDVFAVKKERFVEKLKDHMKEKYVKELADIVGKEAAVVMSFFDLQFFYLNAKNT